MAKLPVTPKLVVIWCKPSINGDGHAISYGIAEANALSYIITTSSLLSINYDIICSGNRLSHAGRKAITLKSYCSVEGY